MQQDHALVLSVDAMTGEDLEFAAELPTFSKLLEHCALATNVEGVFPSLTYPCHVSMATGCAPARTGVLNNEFFLPETLKRPWYFYTDQIQKPTIFEYARRAGISTGCVMWPCMGRGPIDTLVPEIWGKSPSDPFYEPFCSAGSADFIDEIWPVVGEIADGFRQPMFDAFVCRIAEEMILRRNPQLLYVHMCQVDNAKHRFGLHSTEVQQAIRNTDELLGHLISMIEKMGQRENTNIVVCSDHGQMEVERVSYPNRLLAANALIHAEDSIHITQWSAQVQSACLSAFLYCKDGAEREALDLLESNLDALGIEQVLSKAEAKERFDLEGDFSAVLIGKAGTYFDNDMHGIPLLVQKDEAAMPYRANHGHDPRVGEKPIFLISGKKAGNTRISHGFRLIDEAPTIAKMMGFEMPEAQGKACECLIKAR